MNTTSIPEAESHLPSLICYGEIYLIQANPFRIGRSSDNDLVLEDGSVSSHHACIEFRDGHYWVKDLNSTNGTSLNGEVITEALLVSSDEISFGSFVGRFDWQPQITQPPPLHGIHQPASSITCPASVDFSQAQFKWWPENWALSCLAAFILGFVFLCSVFGSFYLAIMSVALLYGLLTIGRFIAFSIQKPVHDKTSAPTIRHPLLNPATIGAAASVVFFLLLTIAATLDSGKAPSSFASRLPLQEQLRQDLESELNKNPQKIFDGIYPAGRAKNIVVHDLSVVQWKNGQPSEDVGNVVQTESRFTLYWSSPLIDEGYTKIRVIHDFESRAVAKSEVLASNANFTNGDLQNAALSIGSELLIRALTD